jgi:hypothetical protein
LRGERWTVAGVRYGGGAGPKADGEDRDPQALRGCSHVQRVAACGGPPIRQQDDRGRHLGLLAILLKRVDRDLKRLAGRGGAVGDLGVDHLPRLAAVPTRTLDGVRFVGERDYADAHARRDSFEEASSRPLGRRQTVRLDVGREHRP